MTLTKHTRSATSFWVAFVAIHLATFGLSSMLGSTIAQQMVIRTIDGQQLTGVVDRIDASGQVAGAGFGNDVRLDSIESIQTKQPIVSVQQPVEVYLVGDTVWGTAKIGADAVSVDGETVSLTGRLGKFQLPLQTVQAIVWRDSKSVQQSIAKPPANTDRVIVDVDGTPQTVNGIIEGITNEAVSVNYKGKLRSIGIAKVNAIVLANVGYQAPTGILGSVATTEGSRFFGLIQSWGDDSQESGLSRSPELKLLIAKDAMLSIKTEQVAEIRIQSDRILFLSSIDPVSVTETTDFVEPRPYQRDRSVTGGKLQIRGKDDQPITFSNGIGVQATSELIYANNKKFNRLVATVGIDWATKGRGDCRVAIKTDGVEVFNQQLTAASAPIELDVDVANANRVSLIVLPGRQFDLADHVIWGGAKLINTKDTK